MALRLKVDGRPGQFSRAFEGIIDPLSVAAAAAARDAQQEILTGGRANIAAAGFSRRWQVGLTAVISGAGLNVSVRARHRRGFATVFETGARISAKKGLIWLPLPTVPKKIGSAQMTPHNFVRLVGPLFTMRAPGKPPLLGAYLQGLLGSKVTLAKLRAGSALARLGVRGRGGAARRAKGLVATPVFHGVTSVMVKKQWNLTGVYDTARDNLAVNFQKRLREG